MKKFFGIISMVIVLTLVMSVSVFAATPVYEAKEAGLLDRPGDAPKDEAKKARLFEYDEVVNGDHPVWGSETDKIATGGKTFTAVLKLKVTADDDTPDEQVVFAYDPKFRTFDGDAKVDGAPDKAYDVTAKKIRDTKADADGFKTFYFVIEPADYDNDTEITIENRIRYNGSAEDDGTGTNENNMSFELYSIALYEGNIVPKAGEEPKGEDPKGEDPKLTDKPKNEKPTETGDASMVMALLVAGSAAVGGFKARKK